jgi:hypothetical protein
MGSGTDPDSGTRPNLTFSRPAGRERLREALDAFFIAYDNTHLVHDVAYEHVNDAIGELRLARREAALAHDRPSGSGMAEPPPGTHYETHDSDGVKWTVLVRDDRPSGSGRLERMAREVAAGHRDEGGACRECGMGHPCHAWTLAFEILHPLSGSSDPEADEDIRADIRQASMGGPDFTPMEWPESDPEAVGLDDRLAELTDEEYEAYDQSMATIQRIPARLTEAKPESHRSKSGDWVGSDGVVYHDDYPT